MQKSDFKKFEMDADEFSIVMRNLDAWERVNNVKFVEAELEGERVQIKALKVATPGFFIYSDDDKYTLIVELFSEKRIGYADIEEFAEFDKNLLENLKFQIIEKDNRNKSLKNRFFPKSDTSLKMFKKLMRTARWKKHPFGYLLLNR
ncbi:MAG TPA: hypothetical protein EYP30_03970 [Archaeoglobaceae archaeon]|nr:hypothetical protein [Archaeoglobaceae archaeon]